MRKLLAFTSSILFGVLPLLAGVASASDQTKDDERLRNSGTVLKEILDVPDSIPQDLLDKADCVVVFPSVLKAAFIVGGSYGRGAMSCRKGESFTGPWDAPTMMALEGGSFGFQIGGQATDFVLLVMNESGARGILASKVKLGADASVGSGPGRTRCVGRVGCDSASRNLELLKGARPVCRRLSRRFDNPSGQWRQPACVRPGDFCEGYCSVGNGRRAPGSRAIDLDPGCEDPPA